MQSCESSKLSLKLLELEMFLIKSYTWSWLLAEVFLFLLSTDLEQYKFVDSELINCTFFHIRTGCQISFDDDYSAYWIYFVNFLGTLAVLPGNIVSALLMDRIGRLTMLGRGFTLLRGTTSKVTGSIFKEFGSEKGKTFFLPIRHLRGIISMVFKSPQFRNSRKNGVCSHLCYATLSVLALPCRYYKTIT